LTLRRQVERAQGIALLNKIEKTISSLGTLKKSQSEGGLLNQTDVELNEERKSPLIFQRPLSPIRDSKISPSALSIKTKSSYPTTASTPSPTASSPAALELKKNLDAKNVQSPLSLEPPVLLKAKKLSIDNGSPLETSVRHEMISKLTHKLKRSQSAPVMTISIKSLISQLQLGVILGAPIKITDMLPPINHYTLRELDFDEIINNIQLRHDLVFDPNLQFKPNDEGEKGTDREIKTNNFWKSVEEDLKKVLNYNAEASKTTTISNITSSAGKSINDYLARPFFLTIPVLINEIKEIMLELLPYSTGFHEELNDLFDVDHLSRQMELGSFNPVPLIEYLGKTLKTHCAPVRDEVIDQMVETCKGGDFVKTLRMCFSILELMKLVR
jgi:hypothetical protein